MDPDTIAAARAVILRNWEATTLQITEAQFSHTVAPLCANLAALHAGLAALEDVPAETEAAAPPPSSDAEASRRVVTTAAVQRARAKPKATGGTPKPHTHKGPAARERSGE